MTCTQSKSKGSDMHMFIVQAKGIQLNFDTSWMSVYKHDKPDSKAVCVLYVLLLDEISYYALKKLVTFNT